MTSAHTRAAGEAVAPRAERRPGHHHVGREGLDQPEHARGDLVGAVGEEAVAADDGADHGSVRPQRGLQQASWSHGPGRLVGGRSACSSPPRPAKYWFK